MTSHLIDKAFDRFLSPQVKLRSERSILVVAIASYIIHLALIFLVSQGLFQTDSKFFQNPIAAIYTPFSFILVYEVYLLIFFLPKSISYYIGKQYEIITLIVIRRIFKDMANLELSSDWFSIKYDLQFTYDVLTSLVLFVLIFYFYQNIRGGKLKHKQRDNQDEEKITRFINLKKGLATLLVPLLIGLAVYTLADWLIVVARDYQNGIVAFKNLNNIFFDEFFTVLEAISKILFQVNC